MLFLLESHKRRYATLQQTIFWCILASQAVFAMGESGSHSRSSIRTDYVQTKVGHSSQDVAHSQADKERSHFMVDSDVFNKHEHHTYSVSKDASRTGHRLLKLSKVKRFVRSESHLGESAPAAAPAPAPAPAPASAANNCQWLYKADDGTTWINLDPDQNWSEYSPLKTTFSKLKINLPCNGDECEVEPQNFAHASSNGKTSNVHNLNSLEWGIAADCRTGGRESPMKIDLRNTPFAFPSPIPSNPGGHNPHGKITCSDNNQRCSGQCGGRCGYCGFGHAGSVAKANLKLIDPDGLEECLKTPAPTPPPTPAPTPWPLDGPYVAGAAGAACPDGYSQITTDSDCKAGGTHIGAAPPGVSYDNRGGDACGMCVVKDSCCSEAFITLDGWSDGNDCYQAVCKEAVVNETGNATGANAESEATTRHKRSRVLAVAAVILIWLVSFE